MPSIGETLRSARMRRELDIADVEVRTKIRAKYLRALENEEFGVLPGSTTTRSFIRTYAELLGLDPHLLVEEYRAQHEERNELELQPLAAPPRAPDRRERRERRERRPSPAPRAPRGAPSPLAILGGAVLALLAILLVIGLVGGDEDGGSRQAGDKGDGTEARTSERAPERRRPRPTVASVSVAPSTPTYACVDRGPDTPTVFAGIMDGPRRFRGKRVRINLGKRSVTLRINGRRVTPTPGADPVGYDVTPTRVTELGPGERPTCA